MQRYKVCHHNGLWLQGDGRRWLWPDLEFPPEGFHLTLPYSTVASQGNPPPSFAEERNLRQKDGSGRSGSQTKFGVARSTGSTHSPWLRPTIWPRPSWPAAPPRAPPAVVTAEFAALALLGGLV